MHAHSINGKSVWPITHNENIPGEEPYAVSHPEMTEAMMQRTRDLAREKKISEVPFSATCRRTMPIDDKVKVNSLNMMDKLDRAYLMATNASPSKIMGKSIGAARQSLSKRDDNRTAQPVVSRNPTDDAFNNVTAVEHDSCFDRHGESVVF